MNQEMIKEKIEELSKNEAFAAKAKACESAEEICALYAQEGIEFTPAELDAAIEAMNAEEKEFSEADLDNVAGGIFISGAAFLTYSVVYSLVILQSSYVVAKSNKKKK